MADSRCDRSRGAIGLAFGRRGFHRLGIVGLSVAISPIRDGDFHDDPLKIRTYSWRVGIKRVGPY